MADSLVATHQREYRSFENARIFVRGLKLKSSSEWKEFRTSDDMPRDIPSHPDHVYKEKGWIGMGDWLGTGRLAPGSQAYLPFQKARKIVQALQLKSEAEWKVYIKTNPLPHGIPRSPKYVYLNDGWLSWGDWLGTGRIATNKLQYKTFENAREFVRKLNLKSTEEWREYCKSGVKPIDIPGSPNNTYKNNGWTGYGDWLGTGTTASQFRKIRSFLEARKFVRSLKLTNGEEWK